MAATEQKTSAPSKQALASVTSFVREHGGSARAVVENLGQAGVRVILVGGDGKLGEVLVPTAEVAAALIAEVDGVTAGEWDAETTGALKIGAVHRRRMAGPRAR